MKLTIKGRARQDDTTENPKHTGVRAADWEDDDKMIKNMPPEKKKSLLRNQQDVPNKGATMPHDYIEKMHVSKSNWLSRLERGRER